MRPYLAIIKDSFREAFASRVLWILLILITFGLLALAPLGFRAEKMTVFQQSDFLDARDFVREVHRQYDTDRPVPGRRVWSKFDEQTRQALAEFEEEDDSRGRSFRSEIRKLLDALNGLLEARDLYDEPSWEDVLLGNEARDLLDQGTETLSSEDLARLNRLLIVAAFEDHFRPQPPKQIVITYLGGTISPPLRVSEKRVKQLIEQFILPALISILVGFIAVFTAILVTASIIPQMFDPGSLSLLLSKPLSRSLMFLSKFAGGCAFIFINITYLLVGLWAIVGLRYDIWNKGLLLCIPIFLFLFAIYYSISAISGVFWRNAIVCVVMTVLFWFACTIVGFAKTQFEEKLVESQRLVRLVHVDDSIIALDESGGTSRWEPESRTWEPTFLGQTQMEMQRSLGPVYDAETKTLFASRIISHSLFSNNPTLKVGKAGDGWAEKDGPALPDGTFELLPDPKGRLLALTNGGVQQLVDELNEKPKKLQVFFLEIPQSFGKPFRPAGPEPPLKLALPAAGAVDTATGNVVVYSGGELTLLVRKGGDYEIQKTAKVAADEDESSTIAFNHPTVLLALSDGRILNYDAATLELRREYQPEQHSQPRFVSDSKDGRWFAVVFHNRRLYLLDTSQENGEGMRLADVRGQDDISAVAFTEQNTLEVVDRAKRVTEYRLDPFDRINSYAPELTLIESIYHYGVLPIYTLFPKPGELGYTIQYVLKDEETIELPVKSNSLETRRLRLHPWRPVVHSVIFMIFVLGLACLYIERQDF